MEEKQHYTKADLEDYAQLSQINSSSDRWRRPSRKEIIEQVVSLQSEVKSARHGSYQGSILFVFRAGGYLWLLKDAYGSCSHCDGLLGADHVSEYATAMFRNAYAFEADNDAVRFLHEQDDDGYFTEWDWSSYTDEGIEMISSL